MGSTVSIERTVCTLSKMEKGREIGDRPPFSAIALATSPVIPASAIAILAIVFILPPLAVHQIRFVTRAAYLGFYLSVHPCLTIPFAKRCFYLALEVLAAHGTQIFNALSPLSQW